MIIDYTQPKEYAHPQFTLLNKSARSRLLKIIRQTFREVLDIRILSRPQSKYLIKLIENTGQVVLV